MSKQYVHLHTMAKTSVKFQKRTYIGTKMTLVFNYLSRHNFRNFSFYKNIKTELIDLYHSI